MPLELTELPIDLLAEALGHLSLRDLIAVARTSSHMCDGTERAIRRRWKHTLPGATMTWRLAYGREVLLSRPVTIAASEHHTMCIQHGQVLSWGGATHGGGIDDDDNVLAGARWEDMDENERATSHFENCRSGEEYHLGRLIPQEQRWRNEQGKLCTNGEGRDSTPRWIHFFDHTVIVDATGRSVMEPYMLPQHEVVQVAAGGKEDAVWCLFLTAEGRLFEIGTNQGLRHSPGYGELRPSPVLFPDGRTPQLAQLCTDGWTHLVRSTTGEVWSWGEDVIGSLGRVVDAEATPADKPGLVTTLLSDGGSASWVDVQGLAYAVVNERVFAWGDGNYAADPRIQRRRRRRLRDRAEQAPELQPSAVDRLATISVREAHAGDNRSVFVAQDGTLYEWRLYDSFDGWTRRDEPLQVLPVPEPVIHVALGEKHSVALTVAGHVYSWGEGPRCRGGRLGHGDGVPSVALPTRIASLESEFVVEVVAGGDHTVVRLKSGAILTCGLGERGVLGHGNGDYSNKLVPTRVTLPSPPAHWAGMFGVPAIVNE